MEHCRPLGKLELYRQLVFEFGWPTMQAVFASYYDPAYPRNVYGGFMDGFALRFSISGRDITPFLDRWAFPYTTRRASAFNPWDWTPLPPDGESLERRLSPVYFTVCDIQQRRVWTWI